MKYNKLNDIEKAELLEKFEGFIGELHSDPEIEAEYMPHYIIYKKISKKESWCYCTHCNEWHQAELLLKKHGETGDCPQCGYHVTYLAEGYGRKKIYAKRNFVRFKNISDTELIAIAIDVRAKFYNPNPRVIVNREDVELEYDYGICNLYYFTKGEARRFDYRYVWGRVYGEGSMQYIETDAMKEPIFEYSMYGMANNSYTVMDKDEDILKQSFLKYAVQKSEGSADISNNFMRFLVTCTQYPNAEYLLSAGLNSIIYSRISGTGLHGLRINWKSNNLKKMLGLDKNDISALEGRSTSDIASYKEMKKYFKSRASADQLIECLSIGARRVKYIYESTGLSLKNILQYINGRYGRAIDWEDYIKQCVRLRYDLNDTAISKPKDLQAAHERCTSIINTKMNEINSELIAERYEKLQQICFEDKKLGLKIVIPQTIDDIIEEGKRLHHCVGGYAERHANAELSIIFLRSIKKPDVPYYTMEISKDGTIKQCRGYRNNWTFKKPEKIEKFEAEYQQYLDTIYSTKKNKKKNKKVGKAA